jgi:serine/threonine protein kinase
MSQPSKRALARCQTVPFEGLPQAEAPLKQRVVARTVPFERPRSGEPSERLISSARPKLTEVPIIGRVIGGRYTIEELIGEGPTGSVYRARQRALDKPVAVKVLNAQHAAEPGCVERLHRAARAASQLDHPAVAHVLDYGNEPDGLLYVVMEYVEARDLRTVLEDERALDPRRAVIITRQVLGALAAAHDRQIVHGNLKPENILLWSGTSEDGEPQDFVKVTDFGLFAGSPEYNSPEQFRGAVLEPRSDLYSIGVLLYQMLTGEKPFVGETAVAVAMQHAADPVFPPSQLADVPDALEAVCLRALAKQPRDRFGTAREMRRALRDAMEGPALPSERPASPDSQDVLVLTRDSHVDLDDEPIALVPRRRTWPALVAAAAIAATGALFFLRQNSSVVGPAQQHALGLEVPGAAAALPSVPAKTAEPTATPVPRPKYTSTEAR